MRTVKNKVDAESKKKFEAKCRRLFSDLTVLNGPFAGMKYPSLKSIGSTIYPKLLGSYEMELHAIIKKTLSLSYTSVVDIGCAEGYYAVGFGLKLQGIKVFAFDTDPEAQTLCKTMGELNGVSIIAGGFCDKDLLMQLDLGERALVISDCEGYENELFDVQLAHYLIPHDVLIETHDLIEIETTQRLLKIFSETHDCVIVDSIDDILKAYTYDYRELEVFSLDERRHLLAEYRGAIMRWIFAKSRR